MTDVEVLGATNATFVIVSFEGPDRYSQAGGLGVRVTGLAQALAYAGYDTHVFFIGDPAQAAEEHSMSGRLVLHRWCQWISAHCPAGVYENEEAKVADLTRSLPCYLLEKVALPALAAGRTPVVLFEEWQTAEAACRLSEALSARGVRDQVVLFWNANNPYGFQRIDWQRLAGCVTITAVSQYMRSIIRASGVDAVVVPNGIAADLLEPVRRADVTAIKKAIADAPNVGMFFKMARWEREKGWAQALEAVATDSPSRRRFMLVARAGGPTGNGGALAEEAERRGLRVAAVHSEQDFQAKVGDLTRKGVDVISLTFGVEPSLARTLYAAADGVLANSVSEPFGLVGLEAMAAGGIAYTGGTGEDYAITGRNAVVLQTLDPMEIVEHWDALTTAVQLAARLRRAGRKTAREYAWPRVVAKLLAVVTFQACRQKRSARCQQETLRRAHRNALTVLDAPVQPALHVLHSAL